jgi:2-dehydro-3-deoxyglucarate aldolase
VVRFHEGVAVDRPEGIRAVRSLLGSGKPTVGSWMQLADTNVAELMARAGYQWVALDLEHGHFSAHQLPDLFRAIEIGGALPLARVATPSVINCRQALDAGAAGVVIPMITSAAQLEPLVSGCHWPPRGTRGVGFCRANGFGARFEEYREEAQNALVIAQIEHVDAIGQLDSILTVDGLDAVIIGPYDLSASLGRTGDLAHPDVVSAIDAIRETCKRNAKPVGTHIVHPDPRMLNARIAEGYQFIAYGVDTVFLREAALAPRP